MFFLEPDYLPFSLALGLLLGLTLLELISLMLGSSLVLDSDADLDLDVGDSFDFDAGSSPNVADLLSASQDFDAGADPGASMPTMRPNLTPRRAVLASCPCLGLRGCPS